MSDNTFSHVSYVPSNILTAKHIRADYTIIKVGLAAERPTEGNSQVSVFLASDSNVLSYWNKTSASWVSVSLV